MKFDLRTVFNANNLLVLSLVLMLFFVPVLPVKYHAYSYNFLFSVILLASAFSLISKKRKLIVLFALALITLEWIAVKVNHPVFGIAFRIPQGLFFIYIIFGLIRQTTTAKKVTERVIVDSISGYLLVGVMFGLIVFAVFRLQPEAYLFPEGIIDTAHIHKKASDMMYYTFITYTTTGYGDILPNTPAVRSLAMLISVTGQLYIAIIIAMLVGKFASGFGNEE